jgi:DNA-binding MarR family transcriptional regulator
LPEDSSKGVASLTWDELSPVLEGLAFTQRPLRAATRQVTRQYDLGPRGAWILSLISGGKIYPLELSDMLKAGRSLITAELARLTEAGLVTASPGRHDRRRSELALTPLGQQACQRVRDEMARIVRRNLAGYSTEEVMLFARMLRDVRQLEEDEVPGVC